MNDRAADRILIEGLRVSCVIGVNEHERRAKQEIVIDVALRVDTRSAGMSDDISDTVDYSAMARSIADHAAESRFRLLEALAESVAVVCLADSRVTRVDVRIRKPAALRLADAAGVEITRRRDE